MLRPSSERGRLELDWLEARYTFSFGRYYDAAHMGFGPLRVINEDRVAPSRGFAPHPHNDMEIVTVVLEGALEHLDSLGGHGVIRPDEVQRITAGRGVTHSEINPSASQPVHLLQIWMEPRETGLPPSYAQRRFDPAERVNRFQALVSPDGREGSIVIQQDALLLRAAIDAGARLEHILSASRGAWVHVIRGKVRLGPHVLEAGDGAGLSEEASAVLHAEAPSDVLLFDLPNE